MDGGVAECLLDSLASEEVHRVRDQVDEAGDVLFLKDGLFAGEAFDVGGEGGSCACGPLFVGGFTHGCSRSGRCRECALA